MSEMSIEAQFLDKCGVNPSLVEKGSVSIRIIDDTPFLMFKTIVPIEWGVLGDAAISAAPASEYADDKPEE